MLVICRLSDAGNDEAGLTLGAGQDRAAKMIPKNRCRTTVAERMEGNDSGTAFYRGSGRLFRPRLGRRTHTDSPEPARGRSDPQQGARCRHQLHRHLDRWPDARSGSVATSRIGATNVTWPANAAVWSVRPQHRAAREASTSLPSKTSWPVSNKV